MQVLKGTRFEPSIPSLHLASNCTCTPQRTLYRPNESISSMNVAYPGSKNTCQPCLSPHQSNKDVHFSNMSSCTPNRNAQVLAHAKMPNYYSLLNPYTSIYSKAKSSCPYTSPKYSSGATTSKFASRPVARQQAYLPSPEQVAYTMENLAGYTTPKSRPPPLSTRSKRAPDSRRKKKKNRIALVGSSSQSETNLFGKPCSNMEEERRGQCSFKEFEDNKDEGFIGRIMKKITGVTPPANQERACSLKEDFAKHKKQRMMGQRKYYTGRNAEKDCFSQLDDLWNPNNFKRWKSIENWDQHKESLWRQQIQWKIDCPDMKNRGIQEMMNDAFKAMNASEGECVAFRMIYGILKRNEDMYLNPYIDSFTDDQFLRLIVALNRFFNEDTDKRKMLFDHPPPTFIEKIMMKETLAVLDPQSPVPLIARRFWELLLDWYSQKIWNWLQNEKCKQDKEYEEEDFDY